MREARPRGLATVPAIRFNSMVQRGRRQLAPRCWPTSRRSARAIRCAARSCWSTRRIRRRKAAQACRRRAKSGSTARLAARLGVQQGSKLAVGEATLTVGAIVQQDPEVDQRPARARAATDDEPRRRRRRRSCCSRAIARRTGCWLPATRSIALPRRGRRRISTADSGWNRSATCGPKCGRRSSAPNSFSASRRWSPSCSPRSPSRSRASRYLRRHLDAAAMMRCLGAPATADRCRCSRCSSSCWASARSVARLRARARRPAAARSFCRAAIVERDLPPPSALPAFAAAR